MPLSVAVIGASRKPQRYAYMAQQLLMQHNHPVFPVSARGEEILGVAGYQSISAIDEPVDTVTLYLRPERHESIKQDILASNPRRIIFNPGSESDQLIDFYRQHGIETLEACTLVLLRTGQFD